MKLLKRATLNTQIQNQRREQINEGVSVAKRVDELRLKLGSLQQQESEFLGGMKSRLEEATLGLSQGIEAKKRELVEIEKERQKLVAPLDDAWEQVRAKERVVVEKIGELQVAKKKLDSSQKRLDGKILKANESLHKIKVCEREIDRATGSVQALETETESIRNATLVDRESYQTEFSENLAQLEERLVVVNRDADVVERLRLELEEKEQDLITREKHLASQQIALRLASEVINKNATST